MYANGDLLIDDFDFRTGTGFFEVPAGVEIAVDIAPGDSSSADERVNPEGAFTYTLEADSYTTLIAQGVLDPSQFADNPDDVDTAFNLLVIGDQKTAPASADTIEVRVVHGSPDAPSVDAVTPDGVSIVDDASYGDATGYLPVPGASVVTLDVTTADNSARVASYQTTGGVQGVTAVAVASGFLDPSANNDGPGFGLFVYLGLDAEDATASEGLPLPEAARVQLVHNAADPAALTVDIFINGRLALNDVPFRAASPFITLPSGPGNVTVDIAGAGAGENVGDEIDPQDSLFNASPVFPPGSTTTVFANGVLTPADFDGLAATIEFGLFPIASQEAVGTDGNFEFKVFHGATDAPNVDINALGATIIPDLAYGTANDMFISLPGDTIATVTVAEAGGADLASYLLNVGDLGLGGASGIVAASGFLSPGDNQNGAAFAPVFFSAEGGAGVALPVAVQ